MGWIDGVEQTDARGGQSESEDDEDELLWTPRRVDASHNQVSLPAAAQPLRRRWNLPAVACLTALTTTSTLSFRWRFLCYCFAALPAVPRRSFDTSSAATPAEIFPLQTSAISLAGAVRAIALGAATMGLQVLLPACTLGICLNVDRGHDETLDTMDIWNHVDTNRDGALSANELLPVSADITSLSVFVLVATSVVTSAVLSHRLRSLAVAHRQRERWQNATQAELRRIKAEQAAAEGSVEQLSRGVLERTRSDAATEREIRSLEGELQQLTEETPDCDDTATIGARPADENETRTAAANETPPLRLKRSVSEKDRQRAMLLQERLRKARAEKLALRDQADHEREQKEKAELSLHAARERLAAANRQLAEAQKADEEEEQARRATAVKLEAEPAYQLLSRALPLPPSWQLFNWEPPIDQASDNVWLILACSGLCCFLLTHTNTIGTAGSRATSTCS